MKKLILTLAVAIGFCASGFSQSNNGTISGYFTAILGQSTTYSISNLQDFDSYQWEVNNNLTNTKNKKSLGSLKIIGNNTEKTVTIEPTSLGIFSIEVVYNDKDGQHTASFIGNVVSPTEIMTKESLTVLEESKKNK
ncbi:MAG: hypothetical protein CMP76_10545 [Flavobacterium sp.]|uniref:hypothetical protein n=1 Tax=Flavobacterium sp. TaxID=239 RepID=UPI000C477B27|nr:hypothetical protein [Flavobacterium sp.]MBF03724.1 hypothetical protein [Flavobacterium sp.]|tara:strand:- start:27 stop:437 length:411 start_codon:yes stop_codon:yes gene_type:complete